MDDKQRVENIANTEYKKITPEDISFLFSIIDKQEKKLAIAEDGLKEIREGKGAYSPDQLTHCSNTVESMKSMAIDTLAQMEAVK